MSIPVLKILQASEVTQYFDGANDMLAFLDEHSISREGTDLEHYKTKNTANNDGVRYCLKPYSQHQIKNWSKSKNIVVYENELQLRQFIDDARNGKNLSQKIYFGSIPESLAERIKHDTGLDVKSYNCTLRASEIRKIISIHSNEESESERGQRAITEDDFVAIPQIIQDPDEIRLSNKLFEGKPVITFVKTINGKTTVAAYVSKKHMDLTVQTMYSGKNKRNLATAAGVQAPANTPEAHVGTVPSNIIPDSTKKSNTNIKKSDRDTAYLKAVESGDMKTAQCMVDKAAKDAGYSVKVYHGTESFGFTRFDISKTHGASAVFLTDSKGVAASFSGLEGTRDVSDAFKQSLDNMTAKQLVDQLNKREYITSDTPYINYYMNDAGYIVRDLLSGTVKTVIDIEQAKTDLIKKRSKGNYALYAKLDNSLTLDCQGVERDEITGWNKNNPKQVGTTDEVAQYAYEHGYDSVVLKNLIDNGGLNDLPRNTTSTVYAVFDSNQIKSADPVTYDNNGDVIPLSKRFDVENEDIRYSSRYADIDLNTLDDNELRVYNNRGWASDLFTEEDHILLNEKFNELNKKATQKTDNVLSDGSRVVEVNNKLVLIGGTFKDPIIYDVLVINSNNETEADIVKEFIRYESAEYRTDKNKYSEFLGFVQNNEGKRFVRNYNSDDFYHIKGRNTEKATLPNDFNSYGYTKRFSDRGTSDTELESTVSEDSKVGNKLYQARPDFEDILFDDFDGEVTDDYARLITEYINGKTDVVNHLINNTRNIPLSEHKMRSLVFRLLNLCFEK